MKTCTLLRTGLAALFLSLASSVAAAFEGKVDIKMTSARDDGNLSMTYFVKGTRMRTEFKAPADKKGRSEGAFASIVNWETREMMVLMADEKMYMVHKIPDSALEKADKAQADSDFKPTGRKEKIAGIEAEEYVGKSDGKRTEMWVTKELGKFMMANQGKGGGGPFGGKKKDPGSAWARFAEQGDFFALRVIQRAKENAPEDFRMEVTKVERSAQPDTLFTPPADYQKFEMPGMGDMLKGMIPGGR
jgi:hypothetical protein